MQSYHQLITLLLLCTVGPSAHFYRHGKSDVGLQEGGEYLLEASICTALRDKDGYCVCEHTGLHGLRASQLAFGLEGIWEHTHMHFGIQ